MKKIYTSRVFLTLCMITLFSLIGGVNEALAQTEKTITLDFEGTGTFPYNEDWTATNFASFTATSFTNQRPGSNCASTNAKTTATLQYNKKLLGITKVAFYMAKNTTNANAAKFIVETSENGTTWKQIGTDANVAGISSKKTWVEYTTSLENPVDGYIKISYSGNTAVRLIDDITITYTGGETTDPTTNTITFTPATGTELVAAQNITLKAAIEGSAIYYTTDGTEPTTASAQYTENGIFVSKNNTTIKALAVAEGIDDVKAEATYTIKPEQPVFSKASTTFKDPFELELSLPTSAGEGASIHYAIDGTATAESALYEGPITIKGTNEGEKITVHAVVVDQYGNVGKEKYNTFTYTDKIVFDFNELAAKYNIKPNGANNVESNIDGIPMEVGGVIFKTTPTKTKNLYNQIWTDYTLRVYKNGGITITAPAGYLLKDINFTVTSGEIKDTTDLNSKVYTASFDKEKIFFKTITVTLVEGESITIGSTLYSTLCLDKAYTMPEGLQGALVSVKDKVLTVDYMYEANDIVAAGMPLLIKADEAKEYTLVYSTEEGTDLSSETMMSGKVDASGITVGEAGSKFYKLAAPNGVIGFYWGAKDGGAFKNAENKAYLVVPADVAMSVQGFRLDGQTTGIGSAETGGEAARAIYGIDGRRINGQLDELPRGIYIVNGKKVIK